MKDKHHQIVGHEAGQVSSKLGVIQSRGGMYLDGYELLYSKLVTDAVKDIVNPNSDEETVHNSKVWLLMVAVPLSGGVLSDEILYDKLRGLGLFDEEIRRLQTL